MCRRVWLRQHGRCRRYVRIQLQSSRRRQVRFRLRDLLQLGREQPPEPAPRRPRHAPGSGPDPNGGARREAKCCIGHLRDASVGHFRDGLWGGASPAAYTSMPLRRPPACCALGQPWRMPTAISWTSSTSMCLSITPARRSHPAEIRDAYAPIKAPRTVLAPTSDVERESAQVDARVPAASGLEQRLQAARGLGPSAPDANGANDAK